VAGIIGIPGRLQSVQAADFVGMRSPNSDSTAGKGTSLGQYLIFHCPNFRSVQEVSLEPPVALL
jgi:hypothetical protein